MVAKRYIHNLIVWYDCLKALLRKGTPVRPLCGMVESLYEHQYFVGRGKSGLCEAKEVTGYFYLFLET